MSDGKLNTSGLEFQKKAAKVSKLNKQQQQASGTADLTE